MLGPVGATSLSTSKTRAQSSRRKYLGAELMFALAERPGKTVGLKDTLGSAHLPVSPKPLKFATFKFKAAFWHHSPILCIQGCKCPPAWSKVQVPLWHHPTHPEATVVHQPPNLPLSSILTPKLEHNTPQRAVPIPPFPWSGTKLVSNPPSCAATQ